MNAKCHFVKIDCLQSKIAQKLPVDIVGVVTDVGSLGSIKRKQDDTEFVRRCELDFRVIVLYVHTAGNTSIHRTYLSAHNGDPRFSSCTDVCRDITLVDDTRKSVIITLWREQAEKLGGELEQLQNPVVVMTKMRVGDYNGVSVSGTYSSKFMVDPTGYPEAVALQQWWESEGSTQTFSPAGVLFFLKGLVHLYMRIVHLSSTEDFCQCVIVV